MSLIACSECGATVSDKAVACTRCGAPTPKSSSHKAGGVIGQIFSIAGLALTLFTIYLAVLGFSAVLYAFSRYPDWLPVNLYCAPWGHGCTFLR